MSDDYTFLDPMEIHRHPTTYHPLKYPIADKNNSHVECFIATNYIVDCLHSFGLEGATTVEVFREGCFEDPLSYIAVNTILIMLAGRGYVIEYMAGPGVTKWVALTSLLDWEDV